MHWRAVQRRSLRSVRTVSYTHLDVYKRQDEECQHCDCKDDADGVCNGSVVSDQLAVCVSIDHLAQALRLSLIHI